MGLKHSVLEGTGTTYKTHVIHKIFEERLTENIKNRPALFYHKEVDTIRETSFDDLNKNANRLAEYILKYLRDTDVKPNQDGDYVIAVCMNTNDNVIATLLAIWKVGAAYLPIDPTFPTNRVEHILGDAKPVLVIYDHYDVSLFRNTSYISFDNLLAKSSCCSEENIHTQASLNRCEEDIAIVLYTSGSCGTPRGVRIPHSAVLNKLEWLRSTFPYSPTEKAGILNTAVVNVDSVTEIWGPLLNGVAVVIIPTEVTRDPSKMVILLESYKMERLVLVPTLLTSILTYLPLQGQRLLGNLKTWICCGDVLPTSLAREFFEYFDDGTHRLCNFYGTTEVMGNVMYFVCENIEDVASLATVPLGIPIDNSVIFLMDGDMNPVKRGESGEIFVAGFSLAKGYVNGREKSKFIHNRFIDKPKFDLFYRTGDFGKLIKESCIQYEGRIDTQVKVRGNRVDTIEIEKIVLSLKEVDKAVVLCYHPGQRDQAILSFVVPKNALGSCADKRTEIENILVNQLIEYQLPQVIVIKLMPLLPNGKVDRQTLIKIYENNNKDCNADFTGVPDDQLRVAEDVFQVVGNVIGRSKRTAISTKSNFYELGGNSLNSVTTVAQIRERGHFISVTDFITANCLGDVLDKIQKAKNLGKMEENLLQFRVIPLTTHHKHQAIAIITSSFFEKNDLTGYLIANTKYTDNRDIVEQTWEYILEKDISYAIADTSNNLIGIALNFDFFDEPKITLNTKLMIIFDIIESLKQPLRAKLPEGKNKVFHSFLMATTTKLTPQENVAVIQKMEEVQLDLAKRKGFVGILSVNTSPLTQQFANVYGYQEMVDCHINTYVHRDGTKPFSKAPDNQKIIVHWKEI